MRIFLLLGMILPSLAFQQALAAPHDPQLEEVVVTAPFPKSPEDTAQSLVTLSGEQLIKQVADTLGQSLAGQLGIHSASFGTGVGLPIIRGQSGNRVQVLQNSTQLLDVSATSPDHGNSLEPLLAERIEVVRGPATLLYGNGAVGGVVNVIDGRIPEAAFDKPEILFQQGHASAGDENQSLLKLNASFGQVNLHLDYVYRENGRRDIAGESYAPSLVFMHEEEEEEDHDEDEEGEDDHDHEEEEVPSTYGYIGNSNGESQGGSLGVSFVGERGFIGLAINQFTTDYGLPPGAHEHEEEEEPAEADGEEDHEEDEHAEDAPLAVRLDMEQTRYELAGQLDFADSWVESLRANLNFTAYEHQELEMEGDAAAEQGTLYKRDGFDGRFLLRHRPLGGWQGLIGLQLGESEFSALGDESFIPKTDETSAALFLVERLERDGLAWELGLRLEDLQLDPGGACSRSQTSASASASLLYDLDDRTKLLGAFSHAERSATTSERYANIDPATCMEQPEDGQVEHVATALVEIGDPDLAKEKSRSLEIGLRRHAGSWTAELSAYHTRVKDYIYLQLPEEGHHEEEEEEEEEEHEHAEPARYVAADATFQGLEGRLTIPILASWEGRTSLEFTGDLVRAEFRSGGNLPRVPPARAGVKLAHQRQHWSVEASMQRVWRQSRVGEGETETPHYTRFSAYADYHWNLADKAELLVFVKGSNLLDEDIRHHSSFLKARAPETGRSLKLGIRLKY